MLSHTISNHTIHHIKSSNIIKCLTVIQLNEKEKESQKEIPTDWESEQTEKVIERNKRISVRDKIKTPEERKKEKQ